MKKSLKGMLEIEVLLFSYFLRAGRRFPLEARHGVLILLFPDLRFWPVSDRFYLFSLYFKRFLVCFIEILSTQVGAFVLADFFNFLFNLLLSSHELWVEQGGRGPRQSFGEDGFTAHNFPVIFKE